MNDREIERIAKYFSVLQNPLCVKILQYPKEEDLYVYQVTDKLGVTASVASGLLQKLRLLDMVGYRQEQQLRNYFLKRPDILKLILQFSEVTHRKESE